MKINDEQLRILENLAVAYDAWRQAQLGWLAHQDNLSWKTVAGRTYLYRIQPVSRIGKSLGPRSAKTEAHFAQYTAARNALAARIEKLEARLAEIEPLYRALRLPIIAKGAGAVLRQADQVGMLGTALIVVGTNAMAAYELEAQNRFASGLDATEDCDLSWAADRTTTLALLKQSPAPLTRLLKQVDNTYTVNLERTFQARNASAYEIEILASPEALEDFPASEPLRPLSMPSQGWLMGGRPVSQVLFDRARRAVRLVVPDPRHMALHKLWLAQQPDRNLRKVGKDRRQGEVLAEAVLRDLPHYRVDRAFLDSVHAELRAHIPDSWHAAAARA